MDYKKEKKKSMKELFENTNTMKVSSMSFKMSIKT
jgi:hypothetical protein